jgi:shikimate kinase
MNTHAMPVALVGPGGAGKSTVGAFVAHRLGWPFVDLDRLFSDRCGDIGAFIRHRGYDTYARENVEVCVSLLAGNRGRFVAALSSGFMTYARDVHPEYARLRRQIEASATTVVLIPSLDRDRCIAETVRRQLARPFARSPEREEAVIRERFPVYVGLRVRTIETMRPLPDVAEDLISALRLARRLEPVQDA